MSDLAATNCGCGNDNGCGCNNIIWIIILLFCCGGCNGSSFFRDNGNGNCCDSIWIILLLLCCCNGNGNGCGCF